LPKITVGDLPGTVGHQYGVQRQRISRQQGCAQGVPDQQMERVIPAGGCPDVGKADQRICPGTRDMIEGWFSSVYIQVDVMTHRFEFAGIPSLIGIYSMVRQKVDVFFEKGYGLPFGMNDAQLADLSGGVLSRKELYARCDIALLAKPIQEDFDDMKEGTIHWGWPHCVQQRGITQTYEGTLLQMEDISSHILMKMILI